MRTTPRGAAAAVLALLSLTTAGGARAMERKEAEAVCTSWKLSCPEGTEPFGGAKLLFAFCRKPGPTPATPPVKHGPLVSCTAQGRLKSLVHWSEGVRHGPTVSVTPDGARTEAEYVQGKKDGREVHYDADGRVAWEDRWAGGVRLTHAIVGPDGARQVLELASPSEP
jgi:hypothetical protein